MPVTYCLGDVMKRLAAAPRVREAWQAILDALPEKCERGCGVNCRDVCKPVATVLFKCAKGRKR